ncbi:unnamed protein product [Polarella glacialis]|uniref:Uncharacterized protein n=1 Tax=Polarella glacialis TaxID=89957 RepID=A0A813ESX4_POLGL|nr:unnamed protein product [Polarella glacialis]
MTSTTTYQSPALAYGRAYGSTLPCTFKDARTMGVAFINFRAHALALGFQDKLHRQFLQDHGRTRHLDVAAATVQWLLLNLQQFNTKSIARFHCVGFQHLGFHCVGFVF